MQLTGAQIIMECLVREGVEMVFGIPGGSTLPFYDTFQHYPQVQHILVKHEQSAAHAADAYARVTGKVGVCCATSGPGATNLVTGIANAWMDSVPIVAITGQVVTWLIGRDGFQEADITGISLPITKANWLVLRAEDMAETMREAFHIARSGRPGPVLIDVPRDVFIQEAEFEYPEEVDLPGFRPTLEGHPAQIKKAAQLIAEAERPLILAGHGVRISGAYDELLELAEKAQIPVVTTLLGISGFPGSHPLCMGMPGMHGMYWNNIAINEADLLIALGMRFDDRVTGALKEFAPHARVIHVDIDPAEIGKNVQPDGADRRRREARPGGAQPARQGQAPRRLAGPSAAAARGASFDRHPGERRASAAVRHQEDLRAERRQGLHRHRRRPAPDVVARSTTGTTRRTASSPPAASGRWASPCRRRWASSSRIRRSWSGRSAATAASR